MASRPGEHVGPCQNRWMDAETKDSADVEKTMLITGAGSGIGRATALMLADERRLILAGRRPEPLAELAAELGGPDRAIPVSCDVAEWDQVEAAVATGIETFGRIDEVFANAGFGAARGFLEESPEQVGS